MTTYDARGWYETVDAVEVLRAIRVIPWALSICEYPEETQTRIVDDMLAFVMEGKRPASHPKEGE